jgi:hypothetical protein
LRLALALPLLLLVGRTRRPLMRPLLLLLLRMLLQPLLCWDSPHIRHGAPPVGPLTALPALLDDLLALLSLCVLHRGEV